MPSRGKPYKCLKCDSRHESLSLRFNHLEEEHNIVEILMTLKIQRNKLVDHNGQLRFGTKTWQPIHSIQAEGVSP